MTKVHFQLFYFVENKTLPATRPRLRPMKNYASNSEKTSKYVSKNSLVSSITDSSFKLYMQEIQSTCFWHF